MVGQYLKSKALSNEVGPPDSMQVYSIIFDSNVIHLPVVLQVHVQVPASSSIGLGGFGYSG